MASFAQAAAILITGFAAVFVANRQLGAYNEALKSKNDNARMKNSLKIVDDFYRPVVISGYSFSPMNAFSTIRSVIENSETDAHVEASVAMEGKTYVSPQGLELVGRTRSAGVVLVNYFTMIHSLIKRDLIDKQFTLEKLGYFAYASIGDVEALSHPAWDLDDFKEVAEMSRSISPPPPYDLARWLAE